MTYVTPPAVADQVVDRLMCRVEQIYSDTLDRLVFHGWSHVKFVHDKASQFATERDANVSLVRISALVHDLNYVVDSGSDVTAGASKRSELLSDLGLDCNLISCIERIVVQASIARRQRRVSVEVACLSDADTLYKALPVTPVLLSHRYMKETGLTLRELAHKIVAEQDGKLNEGFYFYDHSLTEKYGEWAKANLGLWRAINEAIDDPAVHDLVGVEALRMIGDPGL